MSKKKAKHEGLSDELIAAEEKGRETAKVEDAAAPYRRNESARLARILELERELEALKKPAFVEYPKMITVDGVPVIVNNAEDEARYTADTDEPAADKGDS